MGDVCDSEVLDKVFASKTFDTVIHLAGLKSVGESEKSPADFIRVNVMGTVNILEMMKKKQVLILVFSSTTAVYKETEAGIYNEDCTLNPQSIYGSSKVICEELIRQYERLGHINQAIISRHFNLAGDIGLRFFNLGTQLGTSVKELTDMFLESPMTVKLAERRASDAAKAIANSKKAKIEFGWVARASLEDMVQSTIETYNAR